MHKTELVFPLPLLSLKIHMYIHTYTHMYPCSTCRFPHLLFFYLSKNYSWSNTCFSFFQHISPGIQCWFCPEDIFLSQDKQLQNGSLIVDDGAKPDWGGIEKKEEQKLFCNGRGKKALSRSLISVMILCPVFSTTVLVYVSCLGGILNSIIPFLF